MDSKRTFSEYILRVMQRPRVVVSLLSVSKDRSILMRRRHCGMYDVTT